MNTVIQTLAVVGVVANAVVYGTDFFCALVLRSALSHVDDKVLTNVMGRVHQYGDRRMPAPGVIGLVAALATTVTAAISGHGTTIAAAAVATVVLIVWLVVYGKVSAPVNKQLTAAAEEGRTLDNARALQATWDGVINLRVLLQGVAIIALCVAIASA